jgi:hypothetical protein
MTATQWKPLPANLPMLIEHTGGFVEWNVEMLLNLVGAKAAGVRIIERLEQELAALDIGHLPARLPRDRARPVLLYNQDRPGLGTLLHLTRQLATNPEPADDAETDAKVRLLAMLLGACQKGPDSEPSGALA